MSDHAQGPEWWVASDGKWYPPETHPDHRPPPPPPPPADAQPAQPSGVAARERAEWAALGGAAALIVGSFMAWATAGPFRVPGTDGDGWFTILFGAIAAYMAWQRRYIGAAIAAGLGVLIVLYTLSNLSSLRDDSIFSVSPGSGLYLCGVGGAVCAIASLVRWSQIP